jgi:cephalosporin hydroxylase
VLDQYHQWLYDNARRTWKSTRWLGVPIQKSPLDCWQYQEILTEVRPVAIIETGALHGGSALFFATICDALDSGYVVSIDHREVRGRAQHRRLHYITANSTDPATLETVRAYLMAFGPGPVMVVLDSDHSAAHVLAELEAYAPLVTVGSYLVVEDTNLNGHPVWPRYGAGPQEALQAWQRRRPPVRFVRDRRRERFGVTFHPGGWLRRVA